MTFRCVEYHTLIRDVPTEKIESFDNDSELFDWLHDEFRDDSETDISTDEYALDEYETLSDAENAERIHGDAGSGKPRETLPPLDGASC